MNELLDLVSVNRLRGEDCPDDLRIILTNGVDLLEFLGVEVSGNPDWNPWADKSYLTEADLADPDISANVRAIDDTFEHIDFVALTDDDTCIGYWRGPQRVPVQYCPLVSYDSEGQFALCGGRFVESLFFVIYDDDALEQFRDRCLNLGIILPFESLDDIATPSADPDPRSFHQARYEHYRGLKV